MIVCVVSYTHTSTLHSELWRILMCLCLCFLTCRAGESEGDDGSDDYDDEDGEIEYIVEDVANEDSDDGKRTMMMMMMMIDSCSIHP